MFGFFKKHSNKETQYDQEIQYLKNIIESLEYKLEGKGRELFHMGVLVNKHTGILDLVNARLANLESLVNIPEPEDDNKPITTTEAILRVLNSNKRPLNFDEIFNSVKKYNLHVKEVSKASVKSTVYGLANKGKVGYGKEASTFKGIS